MIEQDIQEIKYAVQSIQNSVGLQSSILSELQSIRSHLSTIENIATNPNQIFPRLVAVLEDIESVICTKSIIKKEEKKKEEEKPIEDVPF